MSPEKRLGYAAGLFDGEGCVHIGKYPDHKGREKYHLRVLVAMTTTKPLLFLQQEFGGVLRTKTAPKPGYKQQWEWELYSNEARTFLVKMLPLLSVKDFEVGIALLFLATQEMPYKTGGNLRLSTPAYILSMRHALWEACRDFKTFNA